MGIYSLLQRYQNSSYSFSKTEEYRFFFTHRDILLKYDKFSKLFEISSDDFNIMRGNIIIYAHQNKIAFESEVKSAIEKTLNYVAIRMHTKKELLDKLVLKGFEKDIVLKAIDKLEEYHYVDDELYAKRFVSENKKYSKKMLYEKLSLKGVNREIIGNVLQSINDDSEYELCLKMAEKYTKNKKIETINDLRKMQQSLARKGFSFDLVSKVSRQVTRKDLEE